MKSMIDQWPQLLWSEIQLCVYVDTIFPVNCSWPVSECDGEVKAGSFLRIVGLWRERKPLLGDLAQRFPVSFVKMILGPHIRQDLLWFLLSCTEIWPISWSHCFLYLPDALYIFLHVYFPQLIYCMSCILSWCLPVRAPGLTQIISQDWIINVYSSFVYDNPKLETIEMSISRWMDEQFVSAWDSGRLLSLRVNGN